MLGVLIIPLALAIWSRSGVVVANRSGENNKHTSGYGRADDAYELGEHPLTFSSLNSSLRKPLVEARITNVPGRVLRQSQFLQSLSL